jgi:hypothetical protein
MPDRAGLFRDAAIRRRILCPGIPSAILLAIVCSTGACSTGKEATAPRLHLDHQTVAVMTEVNPEEAERLRLTLLRGQPLPPSAQLFSIEDLVRTNPMLGKVAARLMDCEISRVIPPPAYSTDAHINTGYLVLQRGGDQDRPCHGPAYDIDQESWTDKAGELMVGLLVIGVVGFLAAVPFIFHVF